MGPCVCGSPPLSAGSPEPHSGSTTGQGERCCSAVGPGPLPAPSRPGQLWTVTSFLGPRSPWVQPARLGGNTRASCSQISPEPVTPSLSPPRYWHESIIKACFVLRKVSPQSFQLGNVPHACVERVHPGTTQADPGACWWPCSVTEPGLAQVRGHPERGGPLHTLPPGMTSSPAHRAGWVLPHPSDGP